MKVKLAAVCHERSTELGHRKGSGIGDHPGVCVCVWARWVVISTLSKVVYSDQLLWAALQIPVVYSDQLLGAAPYIHLYLITICVRISHL